MFRVFYLKGGQMYLDMVKVFKATDYKELYFVTDNHNQVIFDRRREYPIQLVAQTKIIHTDELK